MKKIVKLICFLILLSSAAVCNGIFAAETIHKTDVNYVGYKDYTDENSYDISMASKCYIEFEDGILNIYSGKKDVSGTASGAKVDLDLPYTNVRVKQYPYLAIRIKTDMPSTGGYAMCYAGKDEVELNTSYNYADTTDWQTVVVDFSGLTSELEGAAKYWTKITLLPFGKSNVNYGEKVSVDSFAFFRSTDAAAAFTGGGEDYSEVYAAQSGEWLSEEFINPSNDYKMMKLLYSFNSNYEDKIEELYEGYGYGGVTTNVLFNEQYLKDIKQFDLLDSAFAHALESGMTQLWIYDEYQWPSGSAYGQVLEAYPEGESIGVGQITETGSGNYEYTLKEGYEEIIYAMLETDGSKQGVSFENNKVSVNVSGNWKLYVYATHDTYVDPGEGAYSWDRLRYPNIMDQDAMANFIELTHERYGTYLDESFSSVTAFFTDEPSIKTSAMLRDLIDMGTIGEYLMPWEDSLPTLFNEMHGYSILDNLSSLFGGDTEWDRVVRVNFYQTVASMVADSYFKQIEDWCNANGVYSSGHPLLEEWLCQHVACYGDLMACLNEMGIPGCDLLHVDTTSLMDAATYVGSYQAVKFASSAARNNERPHVMVEFNPEAMPKDRLYADVFGESLGGTTLTLLFGADKFVMLNPSETYNAWQTRKLNEYVGRVNTIMDGSIMNSGIAVYYPISTMQAIMDADAVLEGEVYDLTVAFNKFCKGLIQGGLDYNYLDENTISEATIKDGKMICGKSEYSLILMAYVESMSTKTMEKLAEFEKQGGQIVWINQLPSFATDYKNTDELLSMVEKYKDYVLKYDETEESMDNIVKKLTNGIDYGYTVDLVDNGVYVSPALKENRQILFIANSNSAKAAISVSFGEGKTFSVYDPYTGVITKYTGETELECAGYRGLLVVGNYTEAEFNTIIPMAESNNITLIIIISIVAVVLVAGGIAAMVLIKKKNGK